MTVSRRELFEKIERNKLGTLPIYPYPLKYFQDSKTAFNYHIELKEDKQAYKYTTVKEHMPPQHRFDEDWNPERLKWWAGNIGEDQK